MHPTMPELIRGLGQGELGFITTAVRPGKPHSGFQNHSMNSDQVPIY